MFQGDGDDLGHPVSHDGDLTRWADQGVLLLNATHSQFVLIKPGSHQNKGWETFTQVLMPWFTRLLPKRHIVLYALGFVCCSGNVLSSIPFQSSS